MPTLLDPMVVKRIAVDGYGDDALEDELLSPSYRQRLVQRKTVRRGQLEGESSARELLEDNPGEPTPCVHWFTLATVLDTRRDDGWRTLVMPCRG